MVVTWRVPQVGVARLERIARRVADSPESALRDGPDGPRAEGVFRLVTCQRVVFALGRPAPDAAETLIAALHDPGAPGQDPRDGVEVFTGPDAVRHLMEVAGSLDALMPGERQVFAQFRDAVQTARQQGLLDRGLQRVLERVVQAARALHSAAPQQGGRESLIPLVRPVVMEHLQETSDPSAAVLGTGVMGNALVSMLQQVRPGMKIVVVSRDRDRAERSASRYGVSACTLARFLEAPPEGLCLVGSAMRSDRPLVRSRHLERWARAAPLLVLDFAMPRNAEAPAGQVPGLRMVGLDEMAVLGRAAQAARSRELAAARKVLEEHLERYLVRERERLEKERLRRLAQRFEQIAHERWKDAPIGSAQEAESARLRKWFEQSVRALRHEAIETVKGTQGDDPA